MSKRRKPNRQRHAPPPLPNYLRPGIALGKKALAEEGPGVYVVDVAHDDWCMIWNGGACNCEPIVTQRGRA